MKDWYWTVLKLWRRCKYYVCEAYKSALSKYPIVIPDAFSNEAKVDKCSLRPVNVQPLFGREWFVYAVVGRKMYRDELRKLKNAAVYYELPDRQVILPLAYASSSARLPLINRDPRNTILGLDPSSKAGAGTRDPTLSGAERLTVIRNGQFVGPDNACSKCDRHVLRLMGGCAFGIMNCRFGELIGADDAPNPDVLNALGEDEFIEPGKLRLGFVNAVSSLPDVPTMYERNKRRDETRRLRQTICRVCELRAAGCKLNPASCKGPFLRIARDELIFGNMGRLRLAFHSGTWIDSDRIRKLDLRLLDRECKNPSLALKHIVNREYRVSCLAIRFLRVNRYMAAASGAYVTTIPIADKLYVGSPDCVLLKSGKYRIIVTKPQLYALLGLPINPTKDQLRAEMSFIDDIDLRVVGGAACSAHWKYAVVERDCISRVYENGKIRRETNFYDTIFITPTQLTRRLRALAETNKWENVDREIEAFVRRRAARTV